MATSLKDEVIKEGLVVTLGHNLFSLPKLRWFSLRSSGLYYSAEAQGNLTSKSGQPKNMIEFDSMFVRVEKIDGIDSKFEEKVDVYCLRVGDKRQCRTLCFISWEERDFWVIAILHSIAQYKMANDNESRSRFGKIRHNPSSASLRSRSCQSPNTAKKHTLLRHTRSECDRDTRSKSVGLRKRFSSLRSRKSIREDEYGNGTPNLTLKGLGGSPRVTRLSSNRARFCSRTIDKDSGIFTEESSPEQDESPHSPRWFERLSPSADVKRHFSSFITKFT